MAKGKGNRGGGMGATNRAIGNLARNPGFGDSLMADARARLLNANKTGTHNAILRRGNVGSSRGLFDSGLTQQGFQDIEADFHGKYMDSLQNLEMANAQQALQGLGLASSHFNTRRGQNMTARQHAASLALQGELGRGQLGLGHANASMNRAWQEFQMNLLAQQYSPYPTEQAAPQTPQFSPMANDMSRFALDRGRGF